MHALSRSINARLRPKSPVPPNRPLPPTPPEDDDSDGEMSDHLPYLLDDNHEVPFQLLPSHPLDLICQFHNVKRVSLEEGVPPPTKLDVPIRRSSSSSSAILPTHVLAVYEPERPSTSPCLGQTALRPTTPVMIPVNADLWNKYVGSALPPVQDVPPSLFMLSKWRNKRHSRRDSMDSSYSSNSSTRSCSRASERSSSSPRSRPATVLSLPVHSICIPSARTLPLFLVVILRIVPENRILPALLPRSVLYEMPAPTCMLSDKLMTFLYPDGLPKLEKKSSREHIGRERQNTIRAQRSLSSLTGRVRQDAIHSRSVPPVTGRLRGDTIRARAPHPPPQTSLPPPPSPTTTAYLTVPVIPALSSPHPFSSPPPSPTWSSSQSVKSMSRPDARSRSRSSSRASTPYDSLPPSPTSASTPYHHQRFYPRSAKSPHPPLPEPICALADPTLAYSPDRRLLALAQQNFGLWVNALALGIRNSTFPSTALRSSSSHLSLKSTCSDSSQVAIKSRSAHVDNASPIRCIELAWAVVAEARMRRFGDVITSRNASHSYTNITMGMGMGTLGTGVGNKLIEVDEVKKRIPEWVDALNPSSFPRHAADYLREED